MVAATIVFMIMMATKRLEKNIDIDDQIKSSIHPLFHSLLDSYHLLDLPIYDHGHGVD
jgi:hypothetical protein